MEKINTLKNFIGQTQIIENLNIAINATKIRQLEGGFKGKSMLDHVLFFGPPGLGKTTLAHILAVELGYNFICTSAPIFTKVGDMAQLLSKNTKPTLVFIDEIHRLPIALEEVLYTALEDFKIDIKIGDKNKAQSIRIDIAPFTLVGATTKLGLISQPLADRFGLHFNLGFYNNTDLAHIIILEAARLNCHMEFSTALILANCSRGTPRIALRLLNRVIDVALNNRGIKNSNIIVNKKLTDENEDEHKLKNLKTIGQEPLQIDSNIINITLNCLDMDTLGLTSMDKKYLYSLYQVQGGAPLGLESLVALLKEDGDTIINVIEPFLLQRCFIGKGIRGRFLTLEGKQYVESNINIAKNNTTRLI